MLAAGHLLSLGHGQSWRTGPQAFAGQDLGPAKGEVRAADGELLPGVTGKTSPCEPSPAMTADHLPPNDQTGSGTIQLKVVPTDVRRTTLACPPAARARAAVFRRPEPVRASAGMPIPSSM